MHQQLKDIISLFPHLDVSETEYKGSKEKIEVKCTVHNLKFSTTSVLIKRSQTGACPKCKSELISLNKVKKHQESLTVKTLEIRKELEVKFPSLDFSTSEYTDSRNPIEFKCPLHGVTSSLIQTLRDSKYGCQTCASIAVTEKIKKNKDKEIEELAIRFPILDFSTSNYTQTNRKFKVVCKIHGVFETSLGVLQASTKGCPRCSVTPDLKNSEDVVRELKSVHPTIDYSAINYTGSTKKIDIICKDHGLSSVFISSFLRSPYGCPKCAEHVSVSSYEREILSYLKELGIEETDIECNKRFKWMGGKELDLYLPKYKFAIEFNGSAYHHSSSSEYVSDFLRKTYKDPKYHFNKWKACNEQGVTLLSIYDFYWILESKKEIYKAKIKYHLNMLEKVYARKCTLQTLNMSEAKVFIEDNHLESFGFAYKNSKALGLYFNSTLVMCLTYGEHYSQASSSFEVKVHRVVTDTSTAVVGGLSKLLAAVKDKNPIYQITLSSGAKSLSLGKEIRLIEPRYFWVNINSFMYYSRYQTQKSKLETLFGVPVGDLTESEYMESRGFVKVFDNGLAELKF